MVRKGIVAILVIYCAAFFTGCVAARHAADTQEGLQGNKLTVGTVQKEIKKADYIGFWGGLLCPPKEAEI